MVCDFSTPVHSGHFFGCCFITSVPSRPRVDPHLRIIPVDGNDVRIMPVEGTGYIKGISFDQRHEEGFGKRSGVRIPFDRFTAGDDPFYVFVGNPAQAHALLRVRRNQIPVLRNSFLQFSDVRFGHASLGTAYHARQASGWFLRAPSTAEKPK
jgi:hypothetical protein